MKKLGDVGCDLKITDNLSPDDIYRLTLTSFCEKDELLCELEDMADKELCNHEIPSELLINFIIDILGEKKISTDLILADNKEECNMVIPFLTDIDFFVYVESAEHLYLTKLSFYITQISIKKPTIKKMYVIGLLDSSVHILKL